ncbi:hypothetical protein V1520DRAFT_337458 [Lipomyces starkeyi]|uniref:ASX DEUBAD domain-containing protein n=1 Tax=Lipomyces starkeyi NRRL Y-11557 TaxID=675824 RepID=A0A1E3QC39_LIPST|nr:hypothetical protein LIPSTDRAFT_69447 [Lipomyces starkeyi NRRL Y-11557]
MEALGDGRKVMPEDDNLHLQPPHSPRGKESQTRTVSERYGYVRSVALAPAVRHSMRLERPNTGPKNAHQGTGNKYDIAGGRVRSSGYTTRRRIVRCTEVDSNVHVEDDLTQELNDTEPRAYKPKNSTTSQPTSKMSRFANSVRHGRRVVPRRTIALINDEPSFIPSSLHLRSSDQTKESIPPTVLQPVAAPTEIASDKSVQPSCTTRLRTGRVIKPRNPALLDVQKSQTKSERIRCSTSELLNKANSKLQLISQCQPEKATSSSTSEPPMPPKPGTDFRELKELFSEEDEDRSPDLSDPDEDILNDPDMMQILFPIFGAEPAFHDSSSLAHAFSSNAESRSESDSSATSYSHQRRSESRSGQLSRTRRDVQSQQRKRSLDLYTLEVEADRHPKSLRGRGRMQSNSSGLIESLCFSTRTESKPLQVEADSEESELYGLRNSEREIKTETEAMCVARSEQTLDVHVVDTTGDKRADIPRNTSDEDEELPPTQLIDDETAWSPTSQLIHRVSAHCSSDSVAMATPKMSMLSSIESFEHLPLIQPIQSQSGVLPLLSSNGEHHLAQSDKQLHLCATNSFHEYKAFLGELDQEFLKNQVVLSQKQNATSDGILHLMETQSAKWKDEEATNDDEDIAEKVGQERLGAQSINAMARAHTKAQQDIELITQVQVVDNSAVEVRPDTIDMFRVALTPQGQNTHCISEDQGAQTDGNVLTPHWSSLHGRPVRKRSVIPTTPPKVHVHDDSFVPDTPVQLLAIKSSEKLTTESVKAAADSSFVKHTSSSYCHTNSDVSEVIDPLPGTQAIQPESIATTQVIEPSDINSTANKPLTDTYISPKHASVIAAEMPDSQPATVFSTLESNDSATRSTMEILNSRPKYSSSPTSSNERRLPASIPIWLSDREKSGGQEYIAVADNENGSEASQPPRPNEKNSEVNNSSDVYAFEGGKHKVSSEDEEKANYHGSTRRSLRQRQPPTQFSPRPIVPTTGKTRRSDKFSPDYLLNNAKSALVDLPDLSMIISEDAFRRLSIDDRRDIMRYILPIDRASSTSPVPGFFRNVVIQDAARQLQADIGLGRYTKTYAEEYKRATAAIANGETDEYKEGQFELWWGQKARGINV